MSRICFKRLMEWLHPSRWRENKRITGNKFHETINVRIAILFHWPLCSEPLFFFFCSQHLIIPSLTKDDPLSWECVAVIWGVCACEHACTHVCLSLSGYVCSDSSNSWNSLFLIASSPEKFFTPWAFHLCDYPTYFHNFKMLILLHVGWASEVNL